MTILRPSHASHGRLLAAPLGSHEEPLAGLLQEGFVRRLGHLLGRSRASLRTHCPDKLVMSCRRPLGVKKFVFQKHHLSM